MTWRRLGCGRVKVIAWANWLQFALDTPVHRSQRWTLDLRGDGLRTLANRLGPIS